MKRIERQEYLNKLINLRDKQLIKIITGVRRCGKSTLIEIFQDYLREQGVLEEQMISLNFEDYDFFELRKPENLHVYIKNLLIDGKKMYIFLDEIQHVSNFPDVIDSLFIKKNVDLYLTGSNAYMLSSEIATLISGRYIEISMLPLSFREFVSVYGTQKGLSDAYNIYITTSSFPYALGLMDTPKELDDYLNGIYNSIVLKDIISRKKINDPMMLESVLRFMFDNIGNLLSTKKVSDTLTSDGRKVDVKTIEKYISGFEESYILYPAMRYNIKGKQYLKTLEKYYVVDIGLRKMLLGTKAMDVGHILENVIYLELLRRGYKVFVGSVGDLEVDFVAMDEVGLTYFQVSASVWDKKTLERELASLQRIHDHHPKYILTLDEDPDMNYEGIRKINALHWLMMDK